MRALAPVFVFLVAACVAAWLFPPDPRLPGRPPSVSARTLLADPRHYDGCPVVVRTAGFEAGPRGCLVYVERAGRRPALVIDWAGDPPAAVPAAVAGTFAAGDPCRVTGCRAVP